MVCLSDQRILQASMLSSVASPLVHYAGISQELTNWQRLFLDWVRETREWL
tara:strand:- start:1 stop:153 length:153 start_codon:yes stop_codon:yes gene_type:complete